MLTISRVLLLLLLILQIVVIPVQDILTAQSPAADALIDQARKSYYEGNFDQAVALIKTCLQESTLTGTELQEAYIILAQAYLAKNYSEAAREVVVKLLERNPLYSPTIEQEPPPFVALVGEVKQQSSTQVPVEPVSDNKWFWIGAGGALVIGAATFIIFNNNDANTGKDDRLADPPPMPLNP